MDYKNAVWIEFYRPKTINEMVLPNRYIQLFNTIKETGNLPNLLLTGTAGSGKTTSAKVLCNELGLECEILNSSKDRGIDTIRNFVTRYANTSSMNGRYKCLILDECDGMTGIAQESLRNLIEEYSNNLRFICTANYADQIIPALKSRLQQLDYTFNTNDKKEMATMLFKRLMFIIKNQGVSITDPKILGNLMKNYMPDIRHIIKTLQTYSMQNNNIIDENILATKTDGDFNSFIAFLKNSEYNDLVKYAYECSPDSVFRMFFENIFNLGISQENILEAVNLINHFDRGMSLVSLKEVNVLAFLMNFKKYL